MSQLKPRLISISKSGLSEPKTADLNLRIDASAVMGMATSAASARTAAEHGAGLKLTAMAEIVRCPECGKRLFDVEEPQPAYFMIVIVCRYQPRLRIVLPSNLMSVPPREKLLPARVAVV
jgi:hypothetical protein